MSNDTITKSNQKIIDETKNETQNVPVQITQKQFDEISNDLFEKGFFVFDERILRQRTSTDIRSYLEEKNNCYVDAGVVDPRDLRLHHLSEDVKKEILATTIIKESSIKEKIGRVLKERLELMGLSSGEKEFAFRLDFCCRAVSKKSEQNTQGGDCICLAEYNPLSMCCSENINQFARNLKGGLHTNAAIVNEKKVEREVLSYLINNSHNLEINESDFYNWFEQEAGDLPQEYQNWFLNGGIPVPQRMFNDVTKMFTDKELEVSCFKGAKTLQEKNKCLIKFEGIKKNKYIIYSGKAADIAKKYKHINSKDGEYFSQTIIVPVKNNNVWYGYIQLYIYGKNGKNWCLVKNGELKDNIYVLDELYGLVQAIEDICRIAIINAEYKGYLQHAFASKAKVMEVYSEWENVNNAARGKVE